MINVLLTVLSYQLPRLLVPTPHFCRTASSTAATVAAVGPRCEPPAMALLDTLMRRGVEDETEVNNAYFNTKANNARIAKYRERVERINALEDSIEALDDEELAAKTAEFRKRLASGASEEELLEEAFAVVREAAWRTLELRHYDVQLIGAMALHDGTLAQMGTGEGKTLANTCAVYLNALRGKGAHLVTVNDYLARRDAEQMGQVYAFLGLSVGLVQSGLSPEQRRAAYACDVTYVTNSELGFDYLRDHLAMTPAEVVLRPEGLGYCVIDEGDSVLIDEARVPLIISGKTDASVTQYATASKLANSLLPTEHYTADEKMMTVALTEKGTAYAEAALQVKDLFNPQQPWAAYVTNAIKARELFAKDKAYIVKDGEALIIDEFSGRVMAGRRWGDGLHQAIEAKEGLTVQAETEVIASITYQSLFRRYEKLSAMSGTALTEAEEFSTIYGLSVVAVPPVLPRQRVDLPNAVYKSVKGKSGAALNELMGMHRSGRPVLVGTTSVEASQAFSDKLTALGVKHEVLNAKPESIAREAEIIAQAGRKGAVTIATNMAGRGTDILLGGSPSAMARLRVREALAAAAGIAVPPVSPDFYPCALDEDTLGWIADAAKAYSLDEKLAVAASAAAVEEGSVEDLAREAFEAVRQAFDEVLTPERQEVAELGGLHVIGTNLHESRRIDDQLRGRSGRQGDPGSTHFFLSLEDRIFRLFGADKVKGVLDFLRVAEDQPLESEKVTETVQSVQDGVERYYYELRKGLFDFDEVIAAQREAVYAQRDRALRTDAAATLEALHVATAAVVGDIFEANWKGRASADGALATTLATKLGQFFPALATLGGLEGKQRAEAEVIATKAAAAALDAKVAQLDGVRAGLAYESARYLSLLQTDNLWKAHMKAMNFVKDFAGLKVYNQQKPIDVYREEGLRLYERMQVAMRQNVVFSFFAYKPR